MSRKKVLHVEDDSDLRRIVKVILESEDYEVVSAENGQVALNLLATMSALPSIIILDLMMPIMDGFEFREMQLGNPKIATIPVVIMSAEGQLEEKKIRTKVSFALRKPADIDAILAMVKCHAS